jgi:hypothetical protein
MVIAEILRINTTECFGQLRAEQHRRSYSNIIICMDLLVLDTAIPYKRRSTLKKHITDFGTFPHFILTCIKICFSLLLQYVCRFDVSQMSILKFEINSKV